MVCIVWCSPFWPSASMDDVLHQTNPCTQISDVSLYRKARQKWAYTRETIQTIQDIDTVWEANSNIFRMIFIRNSGDTDAWIMFKGYCENSSSIQSPPEMRFVWVSLFMKLTNRRAMILVKILTRSIDYTNIKMMVGRLNERRESISALFYVSYEMRTKVSWLLNSSGSCCYRLVKPNPSCIL